MRVAKVLHIVCAAVAYRLVEDKAIIIRCSVAVRRIRKKRRVRDVILAIAQSLEILHLRQINTIAATIFARYHTVKCIIHGFRDAHSVIKSFKLDYIF